MGEVKLHGTWNSPYSWRVIWALKLKGIPYEYIEEDLSNKSPMLLQHNPVHKKIPVLVHDGKPICESMVILEYIEETWPQNPMLPTDPYEKAVARFWLRFADDKIPMLWRIARTNGEEEKQAIKDASEMLKMIEEHGISEKFFGGQKIGLVDLALGAVAHWFVAIDSKKGLKMLEAHNFPRLHSWTKDFKEDPVIKENLPDLTPLLK
ncbi:PREDICTED: probable glutathione S-transferase [Populus euphratica]|uniref:Glutathione S-transferase n=1 Tax=Populus euphratica TaxID=75702 RepID=A0AAJ6V5H7_POPEU|nr:PREDICTED: probable glutathione S-transferase [Populus euphratica]